MLQVNCTRGLESQRLSLPLEFARTICSLSLFPTLIHHWLCCNLILSSPWTCYLPALGVRHKSS